VTPTCQLVALPETQKFTGGLSLKNGYHCFTHTTTLRHQQGCNTGTAPVMWWAQHRTVPTARPCTRQGRLHRRNDGKPAFSAPLRLLRTVQLPLAHAVTTAGVLAALPCCARRTHVCEVQVRPRGEVQVRPRGEVQVRPRDEASRSPTTTCIPMSGCHQVPRSSGDTPVRPPGAPCQLATTLHSPMLVCRRSQRATSDTQAGPPCALCR